MNITDVSIRNPVFAWMLMASTMLFGIVAISRLGVSQYPDVDYPNISVSVSWPGASPATVERELLEPLEQAISQVEGVQSMQSKASSGSARITVVFDMSRDVDLALQDVQARVGSATRSLPKDVAPASVSKSNPDDQPILTIGVSGPFSRQVLADVAAYQVQEKIQTVAGVGQITLTGYLARNIRIWLDASRLSEKGVVANDIISAIRTEHVEVPGGSLETGGRTLNVRLLGEAIDLTEFRKLVVKRAKPQVAGAPLTTSAPVYLEDVADVEDGFEDATSIARLDGVPLQALGVLKQRGTNAVSVAKAVHAKVDDIQRSLPEGMKVEVLFDSTVFIEESVHELELELGNDGTDAFTAASRAGPLRLRPILMTTIATMMAAVPPVLGLGPGTKTRSPMAAAVLGGLTVSTILSLLVVPCFYVVSDRVRTRVFGKGAPPRPHATPDEPAPASKAPPEDTKASETVKIPQHS